VQPLSKLRFAGGLEEQLERFLKVRPGLLDRVALAGDVDFGAQRYEAVTLALDE
jgi:hypothetical protein